MLLAIVISSSLVTADPIVDEITTDPENPTHESTITVTAKIIGDDVTSVNLSVSECMIGLCFKSENYQMTQSAAGEWVAEITLLDASGESTYIEYTFEIIDSGTEYVLDENWRVDISEGTDNNADSNDDSNGSPGFEIIIFLAAIIIGIVMLRKKRF